MATIEGKEDLWRMTFNEDGIPSANVKRVNASIVIPKKRRQPWFPKIATELLPILLKNINLQGEPLSKAKPFNPYKKKIYHFIQECIMSGDTDLFILWNSLYELDDAYLSNYKEGKDLDNDSKLKELRDTVAKIKIAIEQRISWKFYPKKKRRNL